MTCTTTSDSDCGTCLPLATECSGRVRGEPRLLRSSAMTGWSCHGTEALCSDRPPTYVSAPARMSTPLDVNTSGHILKGKKLMRNPVNNETTASTKSAHALDM